MAGMNRDFLVPPGSEVYRAATTPHNSSVTQQPIAVAQPQRAEDVADVVRWAAEHGVGVAVQASGHGAGATINEDRVLIDTSSMTQLSIDVDAGIAHVGAGMTWSALNAEAEEYGLMGLAGSSPSVAVAGYSFGGGVGWLNRPYGMASNRLLAVDYVDGDGRLRRAADDADDAVDREALWAFRGGGGVGVATAVSIELVAPPDLWAGFRLWPIDVLEPVVAAWSTAMDSVGDALSTSISVLHTPPDAPLPPPLRGVPVVHLAFASPMGPETAAPLTDALRAAPSPVFDSPWARADAARLAQIHLDPPGPLPALGLGRWLDASATSVAAETLAWAAALDSPVKMVEVRNVGHPDSARRGALTAVPGAFLLHAVGLAADDDSRAATEDALARLESTAGPADIGLAAAAFAEGRAEVADGLPADALQRLVAVRAAIDPQARILPTRLMGGAAGA
ncbi:FAD-dependent oxidoreductase [Mycobacterium sp. ACS4331]|uniref:FAD-binding oxidoreductase n=1 Tax=Mycobacterium sp. ACS4331 TaxID=1834121 RepID=UPI0018D40BE9|nr:FAD-dependent oxidoreductase [Mycobacterium sp. ACS4331]